LLVFPCEELEILASIWEVRDLVDPVASPGGDGYLKVW
jgi:hypothetical protein